LRDTGLTEKGVIAVLVALGVSSAQVKYLDISGNEITEDSMEDISKYLAKLHAIEELFIDDNEFGTEGAVILSKSLQKLNLITFSACSCELTARGAYYIARLSLKTIS
jgi:Ran GTPase-activating protein (RanGAP) involved in mRNA processing and transport